MTTDQFSPKALLEAERMRWVDLLHLVMYAERPSRHFATGAARISTYFSFDKNLTGVPSRFLYAIAEPNETILSRMEDILPNLPNANVFMLDQELKDFLRAAYFSCRKFGWVPFPLTSEDLQNDDLLRLKSSINIINDFEHALTHKRYYATDGDGNRAHTVNNGGVFLSQSEARRYLEDVGIYDHWTKAAEYSLQLARLWNSKVTLRWKISSWKESPDNARPFRDYIIKLVEEDRAFLLRILAKNSNYINNYGIFSQRSSQSLKDRDRDLWEKIDEYRRAENPTSLIFDSFAPAKINQPTFAQPESPKSEEAVEFETPADLLERAAGAEEIKPIKTPEEKYSQDPPAEVTNLEENFSSNSFHTITEITSESAHSLSHKTDLSTIANSEVTHSASAASSGSHSYVKLIDILEVSEIITQSKSTIYAMLQVGNKKFDPTFPKPIKMGRSTRFSEQAVQEWSEKLIQTGKTNHKG